MLANRRLLLDAIIVFALMVGGLAAMACLPATANAQRLVDFCASWCAPCQRVAPIVGRLKAAGVQIEMCDVDTSGAAAEGYRGESIPLIVGFDRDGKEVGRLQGAPQCTAENIKKLWAECRQTASQQPAAIGSDDPDTDLSRVPSCQPWTDPRYVKIRAYEGSENGNAIYGFTTGAVVKVGDDTTYVVSCAHGKQGKGDAVAVIFSAGTAACVGDVVAWDYDQRRNVDCSVIKLRCEPRKDYFPIADSEPPEGAKIHLGGFPAAGQWRGRMTTLADLADQLVANGEALEGESGGPVVDSRGYLCGVIVATDGYHDRASGQWVRGRYAYCCRLIHLRRLLDTCFPGRPGAIVPRADAPPATGPPNSPPVCANGVCDPARIDAIEKAIGDLRDGKQDRGNYATLDALRDYAKRGEVPEVSGLATKDDVKEAHGIIDRVLPAVGKVIDDKLAAIPRPAAMATHVLGVPTAVALPMAVVGGPLGIGLSIAAMVVVRRVRKSAAGGQQNATFRNTANGWGDVPIAGRIGPRNPDGSRLPS